MLYRSLPQLEAGMAVHSWVWYQEAECHCAATHDVRRDAL